MRFLLLGACMLTSACAGPIPGANYSEIAATPVARDLARIYLYRDWEPYDSMSRPWIYLNGARAAVSDPGSVTFRDLRPGEYFITVDSPGTYPGQFKTIVLRPGEARYVKIESLWNWYRGFTYSRDTFVVAVIDDERAEREIADKRYISGEP